VGRDPRHHRFQVLEITRVQLRKMQAGGSIVIEKLTELAVDKLNFFNLHLVDFISFSKKLVVTH
jgi:hypothetical protein